MNGLTCGASYTLAVEAHDAAGNVSSRPSISASTAACGAPAAGGCSSPFVSAFSSPGACGYPDPAYGNVGVPSGTSLTSRSYFSTSTYCSANGPCTLDALDISGGVDVNTNNVTISNSRIAGTGSGGFGTIMVKVEQGGNHLTLSHVELTSTTTSGIEHAVLASFNDATVTLDHVYQHGHIDNMEEGGDLTVTDSYSVVNDYIGGDHIENIYINEKTATINHSVLYNLNNQTSVLFGNTGGGVSDGPCMNHWTVTNSILAGGDYPFELCAHSTGVGTSTTDIESNRFARCHGAPVKNPTYGFWTCTGGADTFGLFPYGGSLGITWQSYCPSTANQRWSGNIWDDDGSAVACQA